jgi:hypothetical protein
VKFKLLLLQGNLVRSKLDLRTFHNESKSDNKKKLSGFLGSEEAADNLWSYTQPGKLEILASLP